ncbi:MAG: hypothetical protein CSA50_06265 [Gammaproteobacteria bacterium]|nr:MAG: hypothetical protein CSA50_06265 [Gammaproteobacteria bacterium]
MISRTFVSIPVALLLSLSLFYVLALSTQMGNTMPDLRQVNLNLDFSMHIQESEVVVRERRLPDQPEDNIQPKPLMPQVEVSIVNIDVPPPVIRVPDIDVGVKLSATFDHLPLPAPAIQTGNVNPALPAPVMAIDANPTVTSRILPRYPRRALLRRQEGRVLVEFIITTSGTVKPGSIEVVEATPKGVFDKAVIRAVQHWRFKIRFENGQPVAYRARQELDFELED